MVDIIPELPVKKAEMAMVPKGKPEVTGKIGRKRHIEYPGSKFIVPHAGLTGLYRLCEIGSVEQSNFSEEEMAEKIMHGNDKKDVWMRYASNSCLGAVSGKFEEIDLEGITKEVTRLTKASPIIRYFPKEERVQMQFPITSAFHQLNLTVDSGQFGTYGGNGRSAVGYSMAWNNGEYISMTLFLGDELLQTKTRMLHRKGPALTGHIERLLSTTQRLDKCIEESKDKEFTKEEIGEYLILYKKKGLTENITYPILRSIPDKMSAYDLSCRLTRLSANPHIADSTRLRVEYIAGELMICYDKVRSAVRQSIDDYAVDLAKRGKLV